MYHFVASENLVWGCICLHPGNALGIVCGIVPDCRHVRHAQAPDRTGVAGHASACTSHQPRHRGVVEVGRAILPRYHHSAAAPRNILRKVIRADSHLSTNRVISYNLAYECKPPKKRSTPIKQKVTVIRLNAAHQANFLPLFGFDEKVSLVLMCRYAA